jgi:hypothetical protein
MKRENFKNSLIALAIGLVMVSCGGGNSNKQSQNDNAETENTSKSIDESGYSIKYDSDGSTIIFTKSADGNRKRLDYIYSDGEKSIYIQDYDKKEGYLGYEYDNGEWKDDSYRARQTVNNAEYEIKDLSKHYVQQGFTKQADITVAGKKCEVYAGEHPKEMKIAGYSELNFVGSQEEIAVWNGLTLRLKSGDKVKREAKSITFNVPDAVFSKTTDVTWIE